MQDANIHSDPHDIVALWAQLRAALSEHKSPSIISRNQQHLQLKLKRRRFSARSSSASHLLYPNTSRRSAMRAEHAQRSRTIKRAAHPTMKSRSNICNYDVD